ncbi:Polysaccharide biosynthesis protein [Paenibacillus sp. 1_12]|uniref:polysaccharide biosynthesis protein n=1 Tax=Paenibacillus sp. 1_12 TaxID=1566278 RepID=UPI0008F2E541|nr:polysaccharide biosynthesis protein [Paenibacillus sp. 1_12]SFL89527.1 Polysaccharide biosynthesis protein [Paenibacillus sp. 1_12]
MYTNKKVLIIGGTGTLGKHLLKEILSFEPSVVRIYSRDEHKQFDMQQQLSSYKNIRYLIGDVRDYNRLIRAMEDIDYVFHLAAMKHVASCEYNPFEAVQTNVIGTQNVIQAAIQSNVKKVLFTSTDKAISPTNTYGATKLTAERLISAAEYQKGPKNTVFSSVRFGNVMGSRGSVIPLFKEQIIANQEITVTDKSMSRFMMTPAQAISLMLEANESALGGEVFVLKMPVIKLADLIEVLISEVTKRYNIQTRINIKEIGLRPGEKMYEELMTEDEASYAMEKENMFVIPSFFMEKKTVYANVNSLISSRSNSSSIEFISKQVLRDWILTENLI